MKTPHLKKLSDIRPNTKVFSSSANILPMYVAVFVELLGNIPACYTFSEISQQA